MTRLPDPGPEGRRDPIAGDGPQSGRATADRAVLGALLLFTLLSIAGYATFGRHPELVASVPGAALPYGLALRVFPVGQVWLAFAVMVIYLTRHVGVRWLPAFVLVYALSLSSELLGTGYGVPFGAYHYSALLGPEWMGRVPILIPLSWFSMTVASFGLAQSAGRGGARAPWMRVGFTSLLLLCWDLSLDPAMSHATSFWIWGSTGPYFGMPWSNLAGWYVTGIALAATLAIAGADSWMERLSPRWFGAFYGINVLLAVAMDAAAGLWVAVIVTAAALAVIAAAMAVLGRRWTRRETSVGMSASATTA